MSSLHLTKEQKIAHLEKQLHKLLKENMEIKEQLALYQTQETIIEQDIEAIWKELIRYVGRREPLIASVLNNSKLNTLDNEISIIPPIDSVKCIELISK